MNDRQNKKPADDKKPSFLNELERSFLGDPDRSYTLGEAWLDVWNRFGLVISSVSFAVIMATIFMDDLFKI